jgi:hypothetical protein
MSATLASLTADILTIVKRPDLTADIALHLKNALLKAHSADFWLRDLYEDTFQFATPAVNYQLDYKLLVPRWRSIKYLNAVDPFTRDITAKFAPVSIEKAVDGYGYKRDYVYYLAGSQLQIRTSGQEQYFGFGCYLYPDTTLATPSWIADEFPFAIIYEAARTLFKIIGRDEESSSMKELVAEAMAEVRMVGITTVGE